MTPPNSEEVVKVYGGPFVDAEAYQLALNDAGIECKLVGGALLSSFGSAIPNSTEIWVHQKDAESALAVIKRYDEERHSRPAHERQHHPHPTSDPKPGQPPRRIEPHVKQDPLGE